MNLLVKGRRSGMEIAMVTPQSARWKYVGFAAYRLQHLHLKKWARQVAEARKIL